MPRVVHIKQNSSLISDPPEIEVERSWVHSGEGYEAQLVCIVHAEPQAEVSNLYVNYYKILKIKIVGFRIEYK